MAIERYFEKFPTISYSNNVVVDITKRVALLEKVSTNPYVFYPYEISSDERADQLSTRYYEDPYSSWLLYITNKIVDPYYEWYLSNDEFNDFIIKKYGSVVSANQKIKYYRNNWTKASEEAITASEWNGLTVSQQNYWDPQYDNNGRIKYYTRKQKDWQNGTNKIVSYSISADLFQLQSLISDEIVSVVFDSGNYGNGQIIKVDTNNSVIYLQHMRGTFLENDDVSISGSSYVYSSESNINVAFTTATLIASNIPADEEMYWEGVSYFDYENERNEYNKTIRVMEKDLREVAAENLTDLMKENF